MNLNHQIPKFSWLANLEPVERDIAVAARKLHFLLLEELEASPRHDAAKLTAHTHRTAGKTQESAKVQSSKIQN